VKTIKNKTPSNGQMVVALNKPLKHPERQKRLMASSAKYLADRQYAIRAIANRLNLGELYPADTERSLQTQVAQMIGDVKALAAQTMVLAHALVNLVPSMGDRHDALGRSLEELPLEIAATANCAMDGVEGIQDTLRDVGLLVEPAGSDQ
jgi:hypothetical protein